MALEVGVGGIQPPRSREEGAAGSGRQRRGSYSSVFPSRLAARLSRAGVWLGLRPGWSPEEQRPGCPWVGGLDRATSCSPPSLARVAGRLRGQAGGSEQPVASPAHPPTASHPLWGLSPTTPVGAHSWHGR